MVAAGSTAIFNASFKGLTFLLLTGIFSLYLALFGYRLLYQKHLAVGRDAGTRPILADWRLVGAGLLIFSGTLVHGMVAGTVPAIVFGLTGVLMTGWQLVSFRRRGPWPAGQWLLNHMSSFVGHISRRYRRSRLPACTSFPGPRISYGPRWCSCHRWYG